MLTMPDAPAAAAPRAAAAPAADLRGMVDPAADLRGMVDPAADLRGMVDPAADLRGMVDNARPDRLHGWAWNARRPEERVAVELRLGGRVVASTVADFARPDLARAGIGDGCHAFDLPLSPECVERRGDLTVIARAADGTETALPLRLHRPPAAAPDGGGGGAVAADPARLLRGLDVLAAGHRELREELRALAARLPVPGAAAAAETLAATQRRLDERMETLELWLARLDERLASAGAPPAAATRRRLDPWQVVLGLALALTVLATLGGGAVFLAG